VGHLKPERNMQAMAALAHRPDLLPVVLASGLRARDSARVRAARACIAGLPSAGSSSTGQAHIGIAGARSTSQLAKNRSQPAMNSSRRSSAAR